MNAHEERIAELERLAELIREHKRAKNVNSNENIEAYHKWRTECMDLFVERLGSGDELVKKFDNYDQNGNGFVLMHNFEPQYPIFQVLVRKIKAGGGASIHAAHSSMTPPRRNVEVFISHASDDAAIVRAFRDDLIINGLGVRPEHILCSTLDGTKVETGEDWRHSIRTAIRSAKVFILIITPRFKESEVCQNEMGGAWMADGRVFPLIVDPITYTMVGVIQKPNQIEKLADGMALDRIKDQLVVELGLDAGLSDHWSSQKAAFLVKLREYLDKNPPPQPFTRDKFDEQREEIDRLTKALLEKIEEVKRQGAIIEDLRLAKDAEQVKQVFDVHNVSSSLEEFDRLVAELKRELHNIPGVVCFILLCGYFKKPFEPDWEDYRQEIDAVIRDEVLTTEGAPNDDAAVVRLIHSKLYELEELLEGDYDSLAESYKAKYDSMLVEVRMPLFWKKHLGVSGSFS